MLGDVERDLRQRVPVGSLIELSERLGELAIGVPQRIPVLFAGNRMFRIRRMQAKPQLITEVGAPPPCSAPIGRLNEVGQSVLYLADSPETAFAEVRTNNGDFCISEWSVTAEKLAVANGGFTDAMMSAAHDIGESGAPSEIPTEEDKRVLGLFRQIYTLNVGQNEHLYRWSIACGLANGFCHMCDRESSTAREGVTFWEGRYPFAGIAYPSIRLDRLAVNYAFNDLGRRHVRLDSVQWVRRALDGSYTGLDFANSWSDEKIAWQGRPARMRLSPGESAKLTRIAPDRLLYETMDGSVPRFA